ncbi:arylsulfatase B-like [Ceratina calcarata]|uniref:Arylsulfatase B-like n=1 Tax=Ceratina calcarata TaxID=156304 RepID=A0AAJ7W974_9HYME|nr:arylsulfatase B-like [Ceratina calcarata]
MASLPRIIRHTMNFCIFHQFVLEMNVAMIAQLLIVIFLMLSVDAIFFSSLFSKSKIKNNFPSSSAKLKYEDNFDEDATLRPSKRKPHIILIIADDMGWNDVSFHGSDQIPTPNIDALAYNGVILNKHYVPALCTPSRSALMTGKNPIHLGMQHSVLMPAEPRGLPLNEKLLPQYLKEAGYKTHAVGKWHLGYYRTEYTPTLRGFDTHFGYWNGLQDYYTHFVQEPDPQFSEFRGFDMRRNLTVAWDTLGKYSTDIFTDEAVRLINQHDVDQPMFLYLAHLAPHRGNNNQLIRAPLEDIARFSYILDLERRIQAAVISRMDQGVGEVMDALRNRGMLENSVVLFMSDNGAPTVGFLSNRGSNYPLRGVNSSNISFTIIFVFNQNRIRVEEHSMGNDCINNFLIFLGIDGRLGNIDGFDMWPTLVSDEVSQRSDIVYNIDDIVPYAAIRRGDFKYVTGQTDTGSAWLGATGGPSEGISPKYDPEKILSSKAGVAISDTITGKQMTGLKASRNMENMNDAVLKSNISENVLSVDQVLELRKMAEIKCNVREEDRIPCDPLRAACLFNLEKDPCEMVNLADRRPVILAILGKILWKYRLTVIPPSNRNGDPRANPALWNNTWTSWDEPNPLMLALMDDEGSHDQSESKSAIAVMSVICGLLTIGVMTLLAVKFGRPCLRDRQIPEHENDHGLTYTTDGEEFINMTRIVPNNQ